MFNSDAFAANLRGEDPGARTALFADQLHRVLADLPRGAPAAAVWQALGAAGLLSALYVGGKPAQRLDHRRLALALSAVDARGEQGPTLALCVQAATAVPLLAECVPQSRHAAGVLDRVLCGAETIALAATDIGAGSDLAAMGTTVDIGDELEITGTKRWITGACTADHLLVLARHRPGRHFTCFTWVMVPAAAPGVTVTPADTELFGGSGLGHVELDRVRLPRECLLGRQGMGLAMFARHMATERLASALWAVALCRRVIAATKVSLTRREIQDQTLWNSGAVRQRLARCVVELRKLHALCETLGEAAAFDQNGIAGAVLKAASGPTVEYVLAECAQLQGADGFAACGVQQLRAEAAAFSVGGGTTEVVLGAIADSFDLVLAQVLP